MGGNTPLHLVVSNYKHFNSYKAAAVLLKDPRVETSIINNEGRTQLDLSRKLKPGMTFLHNIQYVVIRCLANCGAVRSLQRSDQVTYEMENAVDVDEESKKLTSLSTNLAVASVLAVSVTAPKNKHNVRSVSTTKASRVWFISSSYYKDIFQQKNQNYDSASSNGITAGVVVV
ncbi:Ankyrin repeat-containing domain-containing protein [Dioscorea alata]|uniref:Ankyrin repeat-containing domain-containing protein n=1 Tax=Dioscorea alata TaxID=55571 RepID=A0ACB7VER0_DIOAL|nr:Ankyrin repeat-containing domain-containing protein [Dioscorea alata]